MLKGCKEEPDEQKSCDLINYINVEIFELKMWLQILKNWKLTDVEIVKADLKTFDLRKSIVTWVEKMT
jgi:hypothetical protein